MPPVTPARVGDGRERRLLPRHARRGRARSTPRESSTTTSVAPAASRIRAQATPAAPAPEITIRSRGQVAARDGARPAQRGEQDDRGAVLVVVHDRAVERLDQPALQLEAARRGDVFEVHRAEAGPQPHEGLDDLVDVGGVEHQRDRVEPAEGLEQRRLALHHRQRGAGADVAEAEHGGAVADHRDQAVRPGVAGGERGVGGDRAADLRDARGVGDGQVAVVAQGRGQAGGELAADVRGHDLVGGRGGCGLGQGGVDRHLSASFDACGRGRSRAAARRCTGGSRV